MNPSTSEYYPETKRQALKALQTYQDGLQIGGGITAENAEEYMKAGASHVIVTSYVFKNGEIYWDNLQNLCDAVGKEHVVLDLSCRKKELIKILEQAEIPVTYAGGIGSLDDLERIREIGNGKIDFTIGSALDLFGGQIPYDVIKNYR